MRRAVGRVTRLHVPRDSRGQAPALRLRRSAGCRCPPAGRRRSPCRRATRRGSSRSPRPCRSAPRPASGKEDSRRPTSSSPAFSFSFSADWGCGAGVGRGVGAGVAIGEGCATGSGGRCPGAETAGAPKRAGGQEAETEARASLSSSHSFSRALRPEKPQPRRLGVLLVAIRRRLHRNGFAEGRGTSVTAEAESEKREAPAEMAGAVMDRIAEAPGIRREPSGDRPGSRPPMRPAPGSPRRDHAVRLPSRAPRRSPRRRSAR